MKTLIFHVGMGKTGSTAIQYSLTQNAIELRSNGIYSCDIWLSRVSVGKDGFANADEFFKTLANPHDFAERLGRIFMKSNPAFYGAQVVIWSNETLATRSNAIAPFISRISPGTTFKVIIYFRNQVDWLVSAYLQWAIKDKQNNGRTLSWEEYTRKAMPDTNYVNIIDTWVAATDRSGVLAKSYDMADDIVADFYSTIGLDISYKPNDRRIYKTPNYTSLSLLKIYNDQFDEQMPPEPLLSILGRAGVLNRDFHSVNPAPLDVSNETLDALEKSFAEMNGNLEQSHGLRLKPRQTGNLRPRESSVDANTDILAALLAIIVDLDRRVRDLQGTVIALKGSRDTLT